MKERIKNFLFECLTIMGLSFILGAVVLAAIEGGQRTERALLEDVCKVNGQIMINDVLYQCGKIKEDAR